MSADQALIREVISGDPPVALLSPKALAQLEPFLPQRTMRLLRTLLKYFEEEVADPVASADSVAEALQRLEARADVVAAVSAGAGRVVVDLVSRSPQLDEALAGAPARLAEQLRPHLLRWLGQVRGWTLVAALDRSAQSGRRVLPFVRELLDLPEARALACIAAQQRRTPSPSALRLKADALLWTLLVQAEAAEASGTRASPVVRQLVDELWWAVYRHERALIQWMADCVVPSNRRVLGGRGHEWSPELMASLESARATGAQFAELCREWHVATGHLSNPNQAIAHPAYQAVVELGWSVVPFIVEALQEGPDLWGNALARITGEEPPLRAKPSLQAVSDAWIELARTRRWLSEVHGAGRSE